MIDLHSHILPGIDDGAADLAVSLEMARRYAGQGVTSVACTPHILPGLYHNSGAQIRAAVDALQHQLDAADIPLRLLSGADNHMVPDFVARLGDGHLLALGASRYVLVEPPHHVAPAQLETFFFEILAASYIPILTHPERLVWIEGHYLKIQELARRGSWMQITSGSLLGRFGKRARYWAERMLCEGLVHIIATDAHNNSERPPDLMKGCAAAEKLVGADYAEHLVVTHPKIVLSNRSLKNSAPFRGSSDHGRDNDYARIYKEPRRSHFVKRVCQLFS
jgi:protein-tyrosine phosphatase